MKSNLSKKTSKKIITWALILLGLFICYYFYAIYKLRPNYDVDVNYKALDEVYDYAYALSPYMDEKSGKALKKSIEAAKADLPDVKNNYELKLLYRKALSGLKDSHSEILMGSDRSEGIKNLPIKMEDRDDRVVVFAAHQEEKEIPIGANLIGLGPYNLERIKKDADLYGNSRDERLNVNKFLEILQEGPEMTSVNAKFRKGDEKINEKLTYLDYKENEFTDPEVENLNLIYSDSYFALYKKKNLAILKIKDLDDRYLSNNLKENILPNLDNSDTLILDPRFCRSKNQNNLIYFLSSISSFSTYKSYDYILRENLEKLAQNTVSKDPFKVTSKEISGSIKKMDNKNLKVTEITGKSIDPSKIDLEIEKKYLLTDDDKKDIKNIIVLSSASSTDDGEDILYFASQNPNITSLGEKSPGSTGENLEIKLSNGSLLSLAAFKPESGGKPVNNRGFVPDFDLAKEKLDNFSDDGELVELLKTYLNK